MVSQTYDKSVFEVLEQYFDNEPFFSLEVYKDNSAKAGTARVAIYVHKEYTVKLFHSRGLSEMEVSIDSWSKMPISQEGTFNDLEVLLEIERINKILP